MTNEQTNEYLAAVLADHSVPWILVKWQEDKRITDFVTNTTGPHQAVRMLAGTLFDVIRMLPTEDDRTHAAALVVMQAQGQYGDKTITSMIHELVRQSMPGAAV